MPKTATVPVNTLSTLQSTSTTGPLPETGFSELWSDLAAASLHLDQVQRRSSPNSSPASMSSSRGTGTFGRRSSDHG